MNYWESELGLNDGKVYQVPLGIEGQEMEMSR
jgi:hypothetical protein